MAGAHDRGPDRSDLPHRPARVLATAGGDGLRLAFLAIAKANPGQFNPARRAAATVGSSAVPIAAAGARVGTDKRAALDALIAAARRGRVETVSSAALAALWNTASGAGLRRLGADADS